MSQLATSISALTNEPGRLPSQTIQNPKANVSMIRKSNMKVALEETARSTTYKLTNKHFTRRHRPDWNQEEDRPNDGRKWVTHADNGRYTFTVSITPPPITHFDIPASGWDDNDSNGLRWDSPTNIYASEQNIYLEDQELKGPDHTNPEPKNEKNGPIVERSLTSDQESQPERDKDPGAFTVTCGIGEAQIHHCLIDLGAAVNVLPFHLYCSLGLGPLKPPMISLEMGDKSCVRLVGVFEDLILSVGELFVATDFYVIRTENGSKNDPPTIILGRPFLYATKTRIDMGKGSLSLEFGGKIANFYIDNNNGRTDTKKPPDIVNTSDPNALVPDQPRETKRVTKPAAMVKRTSPSRKNRKKRKNRKTKPPERWEQDPNSSSHKKSGRVKARMKVGAHCTVVKVQCSLYK
ncbi:unnamed protein product [Rhodiola kirilowii]